MSVNSKIEWTEATWSPTLGCTKVSPGCDNCYAIRTVYRMAHNPNPKVSGAAKGLTIRTVNGVEWTGQVNSLTDRLTLPLHWRKPRRIFVNSQSDLFHPDVSEAFIAHVWATMARTPQHTYQILTKRHGRMRSFIQSDPQNILEYLGDEVNARAIYNADWPLPNVWLGVSVEDQKRADLRIPALLGTPAAVRFLSCEPLLGPVDLSPWIYGKCWANTTRGQGGIGGQMIVTDQSPLGWVIVGGESGPGARPMRPDWARTIRDDCQAAGVPFFFKQWGGRTSKAGGRDLDGRTWDEFPMTVVAA